MVSWTGSVWAQVLSTRTVLEPTGSTIALKIMVGYRCTCTRTHMRSIMQIRAKWREKRKVRRQRGGRGAGTLAGEPSASGRVPKRTHREVQRIGKVHERVDRVLQSSLGQTRVSRAKATDATESKSTRKRNTSSCQEPDRSREEWPVPAGTAMAECKAVTAQAQATWRARHSEGV